MSKNLSPQKLFLIDGLGALLSAFLLGVVLVNVEAWVGMPLDTLYLLAFLPCVFAVYDFACYFFIKSNRALFLKIIAIGNLLYCFLSIYYLFLHYELLTNLGMVYFILELIIVLILVMVEWKVAVNDVVK